MSYLSKVKLWFSELPTKSKIQYLLAFMVFTLSAAFLSWWILAPSYEVLFNQLDAQDANKILGQLEQANIRYQIRNGGRDILIDKNLIAKTRLKIMGSGVQLAGSVGFELFDKNDFGMTDFSQKINYQRALQGELERTISSLEEIQQARVHIVMPESHLFARDAIQPKAAVTLHLRKALNARQVLSIQQLVTASIAHMNINNVVVVDQNGNTLSSNEDDSFSKHFDTKKSIEHYLNEKITQMLLNIFTKNQVMVKVDVAINYDELQRELIKPQSQGLITHEKKIKQSILGKTDKDKTNRNVTLEKSYHFGTEKELYKRASGTIERLSISVLVPYNTDKTILTQIQRLVKSTTGFNERRGDVISIEPLIIVHSESPQLTPPTQLTSISLNPEESFAGFQQNWLPYSFIVLIFLFITGAFKLKKKREKKRQQLLTELSQWLSQYE
ncbi:hypothetical protein EP47_09195 [Legionella norrlandica]|uniref:Flagellar M-ring protein n=1 Tax=Legionella norrlandica TaxID=1498499 RepID=A0A0A2SRC5_9GAMM|nr:flagellar basal-body MS-ring/collar protein FliF [Legionella norrlandica]KGP63297.1 hypothetical protein EP47_09195 [Legionella norrlandica]